MCRNEYSWKNREEREKEAKKFRILGIIFIFIGISNPVFLILAIIFLSRSNQVKEKYAAQNETIETQTFSTYAFNVHENRFCHMCGIELEPADKFCFSCGTGQD
ncbi:MAG: hypothetical protein ACFFAU_17135 [Candidatus Hodarchaeota archaeon]